MTAVLILALVLQDAITAEFKRAVNLFREGLYFEAEDAFRNVVKASPAHGQALMGLAVSLSRSSRPEEALQWFLKAEALPAPEAQFFYNHGLALEQLGRVDEAITRFRKTIELDENHALAWFGLGQILGRQGEFVAARQHIEKSLELAPNSTDARYELADVLYRTKNYDDAEVILKAITATEPAHFKVSYLLSRIYLKTGRKDAGERLAEESRLLQDIDERRRVLRLKVDGLLVLAFRELREQKTEAAVQYFEEVLKHEPTNPQALNALKQIEAHLRGTGKTALADRIARLLK